MGALFEQLSQIIERLGRLESGMELLVAKQAKQEWYITAEAAKILKKSEFTVREWCRHGRVVARKRNHGRGAHCSWAISHEEILRIQREGLLPFVRLLDS
jgi:hypothetical protein